MVVVGPPQSGANEVGHMGSSIGAHLTFSAHLIDDGDEIRERFVAQGPIRPMCSKRQERAIEIAVDCPGCDEGCRR
jgi:hypothetical protein